MSQLLLKVLGHSWCHVPTENPRHRRPCLGTLVFGIPVTFELPSSAPGNAPAICQCVDRCGGALVSCFRSAEECGRNGIPPLRPGQESVKMMRMAVGSCHPRPVCKARRDEGGGGIHRNRRLVLGANKLVGGVRHPPISHLFLLFATLLTLTSRVVFTVDGVDVDVDAFAFQLGGVVVLAVTFARAYRKGMAC